MPRYTTLADSAPIRSAVARGDSFTQTIGKVAGIGGGKEGGGVTIRGGNVSISGAKMSNARFEVGTANINARNTGASGGGAGTTKSGDQALGDILGVASIFA